MRRPAATYLATLLGAIAAAGGMTLAQSQGWPELLFYTVLLLVLAWAIRLTMDSLRLAGAERRRAADLAALRPAEAALTAVRDERRRLSLEIAASLRDALARIRADASDGPVCHGVDARLARIHELTQQATSELRRHLGLLRSPLPDPEPERAVRSAHLSRADLLLGGCMIVLAAVESVAYPLTEDWDDWSPWSVPITALAAATVLLRRVALAPAVLGCAAVFGLGTLGGAPVVDGFWTLGVVGVLLWTVVARASTLLEAAGGMVLALAFVGSRAVDTPDDLPIVVVVVAVASLSGLLVRAISVGGLRASQRADSRQRELREAARAAVNAERAVFARELHDVASHAIGVIALQAGAASVSWQRDPDQARRALEVITATANSALADLDRLQPGPPRPRSVDDLYALVDRIRATGTEVTLDVEGDVPPGSMHVVHRIVQECLTNVLRHAPGARATVRVCSDRQGTDVTVVDDGPGPRGDGCRGYGLVGLGERVSFAGGTLEIGAGPRHSGFRVAARLPTHAPAVSA